MRTGLRWVVLLAFLVLSLALTVAFWPHGAFLFFVFPFVLPWAGGRREPAPRACPRCGWRTRDPEARFCPRDAEPLPDAPSGERF
jgi:hypothetical protein